MKYFLVLTLALLVITTGMAQAVPQSYSVGMLGQAYSPEYFARVGLPIQVGPELFGPYTGPWGEINSYQASAGLPQVGEDLNEYGWGLAGTIEYLEIGRAHV